jgi:hypothetical protein
MEPRFRRDSSGVRIHTDEQAGRSAQARGAEASTLGADLVFAPGRLGLDTAVKRHLLAHELAHVVQQAQRGLVWIARQERPGTPPPPPPSIGPGVGNYTETRLPDGRVELHAWGRVGDRITTPGLEKKYPLPQDVGLSGYDRWHVAGPDATGTELRIAYAPKNFNIGKTATVENALRRARAATQEQGGEVFYDFTAVRRVQGEHEGVEIRVLESVTWNVDVRAVGTDRIVPVVNERATPTPLSRPGAQAPAAADATSTATDATGTATSGTSTATGGTSAVTEPVAEQVPAPGPAEPVPQATEPTRAVEPAGEARAGGGAAESLGIWLNQAQVEIGAEAEAEKAQSALDAEAASIRQLRRSGHWVGVWMLVNDTRRVDLGASIFTTPDQTRSFVSILISQGVTQKAARRQPDFVVEYPAPSRVDRAHLVKLLPPLAPAPAPATPKPILAPGPHTPEELGCAIDQAIARRQWTTVALTLNGFNTDDIEKRVTSDPRLTGNRRERMVGSLNGMIRWPPPNRVADAICKIDQPSHRLGLIDFVRSRSSYSPLVAALALNDADLENELPRHIDQQKAIHDAAARTGLTRVAAAIEKRHAYVTDEEFTAWEKGR